MSGAAPTLQLLDRAPLRARFSSDTLFSVLVLNEATETTHEVLLLVRDVGQALELSTPGCVAEDVTAFVIAALGEWATEQVLAAERQVA